MVLKRRSNERENDEPESSRRRLSLTEELCGDFTREEIESVFEPFFRKIVREEVDTSLHVLFPLRRRVSSVNHDEPRRSWMLRFVKQPPLILFTDKKIEDEDGLPLKVEIVDVDSKNIVTVAPLSSLKLEIVALDGDFDVDQLGETYFSSRIVPPREGKKPLIIGEKYILLKNGVAFITNACFTDNSRWTRSGKFRLGVRVLQSNSKGFRVREAVSDAFQVKDRRGEGTRKLECPSLDDKVWRLKKIRRDGIYHKRLESIGITTIGQFLRKFDEDPLFVKEILRCGNSNRIVDTIVKHATTGRDKGQLEDQKLTPKLACSISQSQNLGLGMFHDGSYSRASSIMQCFQQVGDDLEGYTPNNGVNQVPVDDMPIFSYPNFPSEPPMDSSLPLHLLDIPITSSVQQGNLLASLVSSLPNYNGMVDQMEDPRLDSSILNTPQVNSFLTSSSTKECWLTDNTFEMITQATDHQMCDDYPFPPETPYPLSNPLPLRQFSQSFSALISEADFGYISSFLPNNNTNSKTAWCKLRAAVICRILISQKRVMRAK